MARNIEAEVRVLQVYALAATAVAVGLLFSGWRPEQAKVRFGEVDVERLNLVEKNGRPSLVMANSDRVPPPILNGKPLTAGRIDHDPGMFFYNAEGDEVGGLGFAGGKTGGGYQANAALMLDQYKADETVGLIYDDENGRRRAGIKVWDRPEGSLATLDARYSAMSAMKDPAQKKAALKALQDDAAKGAFGVDRLFAGKLPDQSADLVLSDPQGRPRLTIAVDAKGDPKVSFLDAQGRVTYQLPPK